MSSYVYEAGPAATCSSYRHRKIAGSLWQVWQAGSGQVRSLQVSDQQATNPRCHQTPRLDHAVLACASRWTWTDQDPSRDSASGSQKATLRLTNEPLGDSSPRDLVPSIRPHGRRSHLSYMTSRNALRHVLARTVQHLHPAREGAPVPASLYSLFLPAKLRAMSIIYQVAMNHLFIEQVPRGM